MLLIPSKRFGADVNDRVLDPDLFLLARGLRLVGELRELSRGSAVQREHFLSGLGEIVGARVGVSARVLGIKAGKPVMGQAVSVGWEHACERDLFLRFMEEFQEYLPEPTLPALARIQDPLYVRPRQDLLDDRAWYGSRHVQELRRVSSIDHCVYGAVRSDHFVDAFSLNRAWGEKPFRERECRLIEIIFREVAPFMMEPTPLPPRQRAVLDALCQGLSEKQIAADLDISPHTVHDYVKQLHQRFGAQSRGELLSRALAR